MTFQRNLKLLLLNKNRRLLPTWPFIDFKFSWYICIRKVDLSTVRTCKWRPAFTLHPFHSKNPSWCLTASSALLLNIVQDSSAKQKPHQSETGHRSLHSHLSLQKQISLHTSHPLVPENGSPEITSQSEDPLSRADHAPDKGTCIHTVGSPKYRSVTSFYSSWKSWSVFSSRYHQKWNG